MGSIIRAMFANIVFTDTATQIESPANPVAREVAATDKDKFLVHGRNVIGRQFSLAGADPSMARGQGDLMYQAKVLDDPEPLLYERDQWERFGEDLCQFFTGTGRGTAFQNRENYQGRIPLWMLIDIPERDDFLLTPDAVRLLASEFRSLSNFDDSLSVNFMFHYNRFREGPALKQMFQKIENGVYQTARRGGIIAFK